MVQWLRICLAKQGMQVQSLVQEQISHIRWSNEAFTIHVLQGKILPATSKAKQINIFFKKTCKDEDP